MRAWMTASILASSLAWLLACPERPSGEPGEGEGDVRADDAGGVGGGGNGPESGGGSGGGGGLDARKQPGPYDGGYVALPTVPGWTFYGPQHGGPRTAFGVSADPAGNLWVAGGDDGLFLLTPGATRFRRFTAADGLASYADDDGVHGYRVLSVAGATAHSAIVGYQGIHGGADEADPAWMVKSGDADRVEWNGAGLLVKHFDLATPPGVSTTYPQGRDKIRDVFRIVYDAKSGDVWFGGNHGIAQYDAKLGRVFEHQHADINGYLPNGNYTLLSGDWYGLALDQSGDVWLGGGHRLARLSYASERRQFWATMAPKVDVWPDRKPADARPEERTDDFVQDLAIASDGTVWVGSIPNGLARLAPDGASVSYITSGLLDKKVTALEVDPADGSLWVGHIWGGITRLGTQTVFYDERAFGRPVIAGRVTDIQSDALSGQRRILVSFETGVIGIYVGP